MNKDKISVLFRESKNFDMKKILDRFFLGSYLSYVNRDEELNKIYLDWIINKFLGKQGERNYEKN